MKSMQRLGAALAAALSLVALSACSEKPQTAGTRKVDGKPWETTATGYQAPGWKSGDEASWELQLNHRAQAQNDYARAPARTP